MEALLPLALLACPIGMGLMMWFMARGMRGEKREDGADRAAASASLDELQSEHERLGAEIARLDGERGNGQQVEGGHSVAGSPR
jgi:hypothetical protein